MLKRSGSDVEITNTMNRRDVFPAPQTFTQDNPYTSCANKLF